MSSASPSAVTVAERGTLRMSAISPTCSPGPRNVRSCSPRETLIFPVRTMKSSSPFVPSRMMVSLSLYARTSTACMTRSSSRSVRRAKIGIFASTSRFRLSRRARPSSTAPSSPSFTSRAVTLSLPPRSLASIDQRFGRGVRLEREERRELLRAVEVAGEPVGAEAEAVAREHLDHERVDLDALVDADGARDRVLLRDLLDLLARELPALDELVVDGVILGDLLHAAAAHQVDAAVADVRDEALLADDDERRERRAHAALRRGRSALLRGCARRPSALRARARRRCGAAADG